MNKDHFEAKKSKTILFLLLVLFASISFLPWNKTYSISTDNHALAKRIEDKVDKLAAAFQLNGNILVAKGDQILLNKSYGFADFENQIVNTPQTRFLIGSITKQFTAAVILQLQEQGLLNVKDTVDTYVPGFPNGDQITIHHLLTHSSGLPREVKLHKNPSNLNEAVEIAKSMPLEFLFSPGEGFHYSNAAYILLGYIIEKVSRKSYSDYLQDNIFTPLKMNDSGFGCDRRNVPHLALSYVANNQCLSKNPRMDFSIWPHAAGGIYSTTKDLYQWARALGTNMLLNQKSLKQMFTPNKNSYGYGWFVYKTNGKALCTHNGSILGFRSLIIRRVDEDVCIIVLSNRSNFDSGGGNIFDYSIMNEFDSN